VPVQTTPSSKTHLKFVTLGRCHVTYTKELQQLIFIFLGLVLKLTTRAKIIFKSLTYNISELINDLWMFFFESSDQTFGTIVSYSLDMGLNLDPDIGFLDEKFYGCL